VFRGGGWSYYSSVCRASIRYNTYSDNTVYDIGFRAARTP
jgi:formylglycine-generating enzyme required for sulfatase activity